MSQRRFRACRSSIARQLRRGYRRVREGHRSVDVFLERNPDFIPIGKQAIAAALLPFESDHALFPPDGPADHWYEHLANLMGVGTDAWAANRLAIVTFNYDRSFEYYFARLIAQRQRVSLEEGSARLFAQVPIVHVHGELGNYGASGDQPSLPYGALGTSETIEEAARRILIVSEVENTLPTFDEAERLLRSTQRIYFLGFGFHPDNVRRLRVFSNVRNEQDPTVGGTCDGIPSKEWAQIELEVLNRHWGGRGESIAATVFTFIRHHFRSE
jgi:hypothetical protein